MGFPREEYWSGLPFPSPRDLPDPRIKAGSPTLWADSLLSEPPGKPKVKVLVTQLCSTFCNSMDCNQPGSFVHGILQARILEWVAMPSSRGFFQPRSPSLQTDSLPSEPPGKPKNTGVGSLSLFQGIFPTQESNWGLLHCSMPHWRSIPDILPTVKGRDEGLLWRSRG